MSKATKENANRFAGIVLGYGQILSKVVVALLFTPFLVSTLGQKDYGILNIVTALVAYLAVIEFGMNDGVVRHFIRIDEKTKGDVALRSASRELREFLGGILGFYGAIAVLCVLAGYAIVFAVPTFFAASFEERDLVTMEQSIPIAAIGMALTIGSNPFSAALWARERFVFLRLSEIIVHIGSTLLAVYFLLNGGGVYEVVLATTLGAILLVMLRVGGCIRQSLYPVLSLPRWSIIAPVAIYAAPILMSLLIELVFWKADTILIGILAGGAGVAVYSIGVMFNKYFMSFGTTISRVMMPELIRRLDSGDDTKVFESMVAISRAQAMILLLVVSGFVLYGDTFLVLWLGEEFALAHLVMVFVLIPFTLEQIVNIRNTVMQVKGLYWWRVGIMGSLALAKVPVGIFMFQFFGVLGVAASTGLAVLLAWCLLAVVLQVKAGIPMVKYISQLGAGILPALVCALAVGMIADQIFANDLLGFVVKVATFSAAYMALMMTLGVRPVERDYVKGLIVGMQARLGM